MPNIPTLPAFAVLFHSNSGCPLVDRITDVLGEMCGAYLCSPLLSQLCGVGWKDLVIEAFHAFAANFEIEAGKAFSEVVPLDGLALVREDLVGHIFAEDVGKLLVWDNDRSEEHTSELQSLRH